jgi:glutathionylspermidine synthase
MVGMRGGRVPIRALRPVDRQAFAELRERTIFECFKCDPQVGDVDVLAPFPLVIGAEDWRFLASSAERLAAETAAMEEELVRRPELHNGLGVPRSIRRLFADTRGGEPSVAGGRLIRFDFHWTTDGWRISEANADVPGGFIESAGFARLMAERYPGARLAADPCGHLADAVERAVGERATAAFVHATAYTDDGQVMMYIADRLASRGITAHLAAPDHIVWRDGRASIASAWALEKIDFIFRFTPAEWLCNLPRHSHWKSYFRGSRTPICNPGAALLTQSKRLPLVWDRLRTRVPAWRSLLPETRDPRDCPGRNGDWVLKPALGRVGEDVLVPEATTTKDAAQIRKAAARHPGHWIAQKRFSIVAVSAEGTEFFPCIGVYTVDGKAAGLYGRIAEKPLIDSYARDVAVLVEEEHHGGV